MVEYRGSRFEEMDTDAILRRHPQVAVVDEFPHTNVPARARLKRWEDVHVLLDAGIDVLTTMNVQHLESLNDQIWQSTGVRVRETIPDWVLKQADEVVMVDVTPRALFNRLAAASSTRRNGRGRRWRTSSRNRRWSRCASWPCGRPRYAVESRLPDEEPSPRSAKEPRRTERIARSTAARAWPRSLERGADPPRPPGRRLPARGVPGGLRVEDADLGELTQRGTRALERHLNFARGLQIETRVLQGSDVAETIVTFARLHGGHPDLRAREDHRRCGRGSRRRSSNGSCTSPATCR